MICLCAISCISLFVKSFCFPCGIFYKPFFYNVNERARFFQSFYYLNTFELTQMQLYSIAIFILWNVGNQSSQKLWKMLLLFIFHKELFVNLMCHRCLNIFLLVFVEFEGDQAKPDLTIQSVTNLNLLSSIVQVFNSKVGDRARQAEKVSTILQIATIILWRRLK